MGDDSSPVIVTGEIDKDTHWYGRTPHGELYSMQVRPGTSDWNTVHACGGTNDEYKTPDGLTGWGLDVGAHIGAWTVPTLIDNPGLRLVAIEALTENVDLLIRNLERNALRDRCYVLQRAAGGDARIYYSTDAQHRFIGNAGAPDGSHHHPTDGYLDVAGITLDNLLKYPGETDGFTIAKIDCEGCEYPFLSSEWVGKVALILGEVHHGWQRLVDILSPTHDVGGDGADFGHFRAVRRAAL